MAHTIKISGISDDLIARVERWRGQHFADRSEYIRELIRKDVLPNSQTVSESVKAIFGAVHEEVTRLGYSDEEIARDVAEALSETRIRRKNAKP
jgi:metal-responsive CopG/Arc/MetJ family transcriptional regulator